MKKTCTNRTSINTAITLALSTSLLTASLLANPALASSVDAENPDDKPASPAILANPDSHNDSHRIDQTIDREISRNDDEDSTRHLYTGMGVGAVAGTAVAGPVGLVVGGLIGALIGSSQGPETAQPELAAGPAPTVSPSGETTPVATHASPDSTAQQAMPRLAQLGDGPLPYTEPATRDADTPYPPLPDGLSFDVYFRSGSTAIETFYPARLAAIADFVNHVDKVNIHLDGYADRRGDSRQNAALAKARIDSVRRQLIDAGVDEKRIIDIAFGEMKMVSAPGDLDAYVFDRKVVIRFEPASDNAFAGNTPVNSGSPARQPQIAGSDGAALVADALPRF